MTFYLNDLSLALISKWQTKMNQELKLLYENFGKKQNLNLLMPSFYLDMLVECQNRMDMVTLEITTQVCLIEAIGTIRHSHEIKYLDHYKPGKKIHFSWTTKQLIHNYYACKKDYKLYRFCRRILFLCLLIMWCKSIPLNSFCQVCGGHSLILEGAMWT